MEARTEQSQQRRVRVIPATKTERSQPAGKKKAKLRVAAYCRVSTDSEEQLNSYEAQKAYYSKRTKTCPFSEGNSAWNGKCGFAGKDDVVIAYRNPLF